MPSTCTMRQPNSSTSARGNGLAGARIGDEIVGLVCERLLDDDRVVEPDHDPAGVSPFHPRREQVGAGLLKRRGDGDPPVEMARQRLEVQVPLGDGTPQVLSLIQRDQAGTDVVDIGSACQSSCFGLDGDVVLDVLQELVEQDLVRLEVDAAAVAEAEVDRGPAAGGLRSSSASNSPQAPRIWSSRFVFQPSSLSP